MRKLLLVLAIGLLASCTRQEDDVIAREMESNIIVDFRQFPARTVYTITNDQGLGVFRFDSDSSNYFVQTIPAGTYHTTWELIGITENKNYKAKMLNHNQGTVADWKTGVIYINGHELSGSFIFSRVPN